MGILDELAVEMKLDQPVGQAISEGLVPPPSKPASVLDNLASEMGLDTPSVGDSHWMGAIKQAGLETLAVPSHALKTIGRVIPGKDIIERTADENIA